MAINLEKVVQDLESAPPETRSVAVTLLLRIPAEQLLADRELFHRLCHGAEQGALKEEGDLGDLFARLRDRLQQVRMQSLPDRGKEKLDLSGLGRGDPRTQISTLEAIAAGKHTQALGEIRALLEVGAMDRVLAVAVDTLGRLGNPGDDLARIRNHLGHHSGRVRAAAVEAFAALSDPDQIVLTLGPALGDRHPMVRAGAIRAFSVVGREALIERLKSLVQNEAPERRALALPLLSYLRGDAILELLRKMAADPSEAIRAEVVNILRAHGGRQVMSTLEWLAQDRSQAIKAHAARSMALLRAGRGMRPGFDLAQLDSVPREPPSMGEVPDLASLPPQTQNQYLMRMKLVGSPRIYDLLLPLLDREDLRVEVLASVLSAFSVVGGREDVNRIRPFLAHSDGRVRANAVEAIDIMGGRKEILTWLTPLLADPMPRVKQNVLTALGRFGEGVFLNHLQRMIHSPHSAVRVSGVYALAHYPGPAAQQLAVKVLEDRDREVRLNFAEAMAGRQEPWARGLLERMQKADLDMDVRNAAKTSLEAAPQPTVEGGGDDGIPTGPARSPGASSPPARPPTSAPPMAPGGAPGPGQAPGAGRAGPGRPVPGPPGPTAAPGSGPGAPPAGVLPSPPGGPQLPPAEAFTMVDGLPMCPAPDLPPPSVRMAASVVGVEGRRGEVASEDQFRSSIDAAADEVLGMAQQAAAELARMEHPRGADAEASSAENRRPAPIPSSESGDMVLETMGGMSDPGDSTDSLGQTFMNFAALISPGKLAVMKKVQELERQRDEVLEKLGRALWDKISRGDLQHEGFSRTLFVLKKYLHGMKDQKKGGGGDAQASGWLSKLFTGGGEGGAGGDVREPPQLRTQYRNLAKDALRLDEMKDLDLAEFSALVGEIRRFDAEIKGLSEKPA